MEATCRVQGKEINISVYLMASRDTVGFFLHHITLWLFDCNYFSGFNKEWGMLVYLLMRIKIVRYLLKEFLTGFVCLQLYIDCEPLLYFDEESFD